jgi:hypothetical protein
MKANPGGYIPPEEVIGRDVLIARLWSILERQSLVLSAERRMGKTRVMDKMRLQAPGDKLPYLRDLEKVHTAAEFAHAVYEDVEDALSRSNRTGTRARQFFAGLSGVEVSGIKLPAVVGARWKELLARTIEDLVENQDKTVIFFWDEMPWMLENIRANDGDRAAMELLDTLRELRQAHPRLRMVFTGSVGLHHVLSALKEQGYANAPVNDMYPLDVPPLAPPDARELARLLLEGEGTASPDAAAAARAIAAAVDNNAFYIHHVVDRMKERGAIADEATVAAIVSDFLVDAHDPWDLRHYRARLNTYYKGAAPLALRLLDILAVEPSALGFNEVFNRLQSQVSTAEEESARDLLTLLGRDHYTERDSEGKYFFRGALLRRWWRLDRGLE